MVLKTDGLICQKRIAYRKTESTILKKFLQTGQKNKNEK